MSRKASLRELAGLITQSRKVVQHGLWRHRASGVLYLVREQRVIDEKTATPLVLYHRVGGDHGKDEEIVWARDQVTFMAKFAKETRGDNCEVKQ